MQNTNSDHNVKKTTSMRLSQHYIWSIPTPSMPSSIIRFINHRFTLPPSPNLTIVIIRSLTNKRISVVTVDLSSRPCALYLPWRVLLRAILFAKGGILPPIFINTTG